MRFQPPGANFETMLDDQVLDYYAQGGEAKRLDGTLELLRTKVLLERLLPEPPAAVLDVGGAFGVYATWLAERGYDVRLVDPVPLHVDTAAGLGIDAIIGDARALAEPDASRDVVLLFGPLYHLLDRADRVRALAEARRVVRPGGLVLAVAISRWAPTYEGLLGRSIDIPGFVGMLREAQATGVRPGPFGPGDNFTSAYFHRPDDLAAEVADAGLVLDDQYAVEGIAHWMPDITARLADPADRALILELVANTEREPAVLGATAHLLAATHR
jgi:SAM-dependent methyltransferase